MTVGVGGGIAGGVDAIKVGVEVTVGVEATACTTASLLVVLVTLSVNCMEDLMISKTGVY